MDPARWQEVPERFDEIAELDSAPRGVRLMELGRRDPELRREVERLLASDAAADARLAPLEDAFGVPRDALSHDGMPPGCRSFDPLGVVGRTVAHFRVIEPIASGGMGVVYRAVDMRIGRHVAVKFPLPHLLTDATVRARFVTEGRAAGALDHPNVCSIHQVGESAEGHVYIAMAFCPGETLKARLDARGRLPADEAVAIVRGIARGLGAAHAAGIVHRDVKPGNVMLLPDGGVKLLDFGLARLSEPERSATGTMAGTAAYMAPEQIRGEPTDARTDLWALGVVLYEMLGGKRPFGGRHDAAVTYAIVHEVPAPLTALAPRVPQALDALVRALLEKDRALRPVTAAQVEAWLDAPAFSNGETCTPNAPLSAVRRRRVRGVALTVSLAAVALAAYAGNWPARLGGDPPVAGTERKTLAVLPFKNLGRPEDAYFADGVTEEITSRLASLSGLGVISRASADQYRNTTKPLKQIARELGVEYVLDGSVRWEKGQDGRGRVRVAPQLIRASDDSHLWADQFDASAADVFRVQAEIANGVAEALAVALRSGEQRSIERMPTTSPEAHDHYLRAKALMGRGLVSYRQREGTTAALAELERAVALDPDFALAYAALADAHTAMYFLTVDPTPARLSLARRAGEKALRLDPGSAAVHATLGSYYFNGELDLNRALERFENALRLQPSNADLLLSIGLIERAKGKWLEAAASLERAATLDPHNFVALGYLGRTYLTLRDYTRAAQSFDRAIAAEADAPFAYVWRAHVALASEGDTTAAREILARATDRLGVERIGRVYASRGFFFPWVISDAVMPRALERLSLAAIERDTAGYFLFRARWARHRGDHARAHAYADSARRALERDTVRAGHGDERLFDERVFHADLGLAYALLGLQAAALREADALAAMRDLGGERAPEDDAVKPSVRALELAQIHTTLGNADAAVAQLERAFALPGYLSPALLRVDPTWDRLRANPRFQRLLQAGPTRD